MLPTADLDYHLPEDLIPTAPADPRDAARLLVVSRSDPGLIQHRHVRDLPSLLRTGPSPDLLVLNTTRVLAARFVGLRSDTGGRAEGLYIGPGHAPGEMPTGVRWTVLLKMRRMRPGVRVSLLSRTGDPSGVSLLLLERVGADGGWLVEVESSDLALVPGVAAEDLLERVGLTPVPPYILAARKRHDIGIADDVDRERYQTVYASEPDPAQGPLVAERNTRIGGSVAAPTAGLHFTPELLATLAAGGVPRAEVVLHVGLGTFKPVEAEFVEQHPIHAEWCAIEPHHGQAILDARSRGSPSSQGSRVIGVGTTTARALESFSDDHLRTGHAHATKLLITPGHHWRHLDGLLTNFHLPRSTLLAMVASLFSTPGSSGVERIRALYALAIEHRYRFYSYGDAMLILP